MRYLIPVCVEHDGLLHRAGAGVFSQLAVSGQFGKGVKAIVWVSPDDFNALFSGRAQIVHSRIQAKIPLPEFTFPGEYCAAQ